MFVPACKKNFVYFRATPHNSSADAASEKYKLLSKKRR